jgi:hypothetical protein
MRGNKLNVLIACESSGAVRRAFRALGHNAWSCDLLPSDDASPYHVQGDVLDVLRFGRPWRIPRPGGKFKWDLLIGHPPCTYLCNSGVRWLTWRAHPAMRMNWSEDRWKKMEDAVIFFSRLYTSDVPYIALENPIMHGHAKRLIGARLGVGNQQQSQIIQPWQFGHGETKATCLWLRNLPKLVPTNVVAGREHRVHKMPPGPDRWKERSKTFVGIAQAMAQQWSAHILAEKQKGTKSKN